MEDPAIVDLYWERSETAIEETWKKYGGYCYSIAYHILHCSLDAEECVSDTYLNAWNAIPPERPGKLQQYLGAVTRNLALNRYDYNNAQKRFCESTVVLDEYYECIAGETASMEDELLLKEIFDRFLASLPVQTRIVFVRRYWYFCSVKEIAAGMQLPDGTVKSLLHRTRKKFKKYLKKEGLLL